MSDFRYSIKKNSVKVYIEESHGLGGDDDTYTADLSKEEAVKFAKDILKQFEVDKK